MSLPMRAVGIAAAESTGVAKRSAYLDNLRSFVIFLVVALHASVTYSGYGSWYYRETSPDRLDIASRAVFGLFEAFTQAWFMGILFFLAAFFATKSLAKRGPAAFVRERLLRLGLPLLVYMLVIEPFIAYFIMDYGNMRERYGLGRFYLGYLSSFRWLGGTGPLWFVEALLFFSLPYAALRALRPAKRAQAPAPATLTTILIILGTGLLAFSIRLFQPVGTNLANLQLCYFGAYIVLFILGVHAGERGWLEAYPEKRGLRWFVTVLCAGPVLLIVLLVVSGAIRGSTLINGGLNWQSFAYAFWEAFVAIGFSLGLVAFFRRRFDRETAFTGLLSRNSFAIYMFHAPILITISLLLRHWQGYFLLKALVVAPLAFSVTLALSFLVLRRIPGLKALLK